ncbi:MAG: 50S ribosomal protein L32 [Patescibacteria group bacterium]
MAPLPKKKHTRSRSNKRRSKVMAIKLGTLSKCTSCGKLRQPHRACPYCGFYGEASHSK